MEKNVRKVYVVQTTKEKEYPKCSIHNLLNNHNYFLKSMKFLTQRLGNLKLMSLILDFIFESDASFLEKFHSF